MSSIPDHDPALKFHPLLASREVAMKSQKQNNKAPRPFKSSQSERGGWSGGRQQGFIPAPKFPQPVKKTAPPAPSEEAP
jgi:hypothetical protein